MEPLGASCVTADAIVARPNAPRVTLSTLNNIFPHCTLTGTHTTKIFEARGRASNTCAAPPPLPRIPDVSQSRTYSINSEVSYNFGKHE
uniref:Uncharacterized protein n=1 Tax=Pararge aegeria TaxID=116150 RepID=S4PBN9_9NEOP